MGDNTDFNQLDFQASSLDRRNGNNNILQEMFQEVKHMRQELNSHIQDEAAIIAKAFPDKDLEAHRVGHELQNKLLAEKADFWAKLRVSVTTWGMIGVLGFVAVTVWKAFLLGPVK